MSIKNILELIKISNPYSEKSQAKLKLKDFLVSDSAMDY